jgi:hypothetical protein
MAGDLIEGTLSELSLSSVFVLAELLIEGLQYLLCYETISFII